MKSRRMQDIAVLTAIVLGFAAMVAAQWLVGAYAVAAYASAAVIVTVAVAAGGYQVYQGKHYPDEDGYEFRLPIVAGEQRAVVYLDKVADSKRENVCMWLSRILHEGMVYTDHMQNRARRSRLDDVRAENERLAEEIVRLTMPVPRESQRQQALAAATGAGIRPEVETTAAVGDATPPTAAAPDFDKKMAAMMAALEKTVATVEKTADAVKLLAANQQLATEPEELSAGATQTRVAPSQLRETATL